MRQLFGFDPDHAVQDQPPDEDTITHYDWWHAITYWRLLDAQLLGTGWEKTVYVVLRRNPSAEPVQARLCWESHLARAHWMVKKGYLPRLDDGEIAFAGGT